jgi:uncharacterized protein YbaP (TraB family)
MISLCCNRFSARVRFCLLCCLLVLVAPAAWSATSLWTVSKDGRQLFLGGTLHLLSEQDFPLPGEYARAYAQADRLVLESDLDAVNSPEFQQALLSRLTYPPGESLRGHLSAETYAALEAHCRERGIPVATLNQFKPPLVSLSLSVLELQRLGLSQPGVDEFFYRRAVADAKPIDTLETTEQQLEFLVNMGQGRDDELITSTLREMQAAAQMVNDMRTGWRNGDEQRLMVSTIAPLRKEFPEVYQALLVERNKNWLEDIEAMLQSPELELILVGAAHLVGDEGMLSLLRQRGYRVESFTAP